MVCARIEKRRHDSKRPELREVRQRAECGSEPFLNVLIQLLMQRAEGGTASPFEFCQVLIAVDSNKH